MGRTDDTTTLAELDAMTPPARGAWVRAQAEPAARVAELVEAVRRLVISDLPKALRSTEVLVEMSDHLDDRALRARARRARAQALAYANRFDDALDTLDEAVTLAGACGDGVEQARAKMAMLHGLARLGRYDEAAARGAEALEAFAAAGEETLAAKASANLAETWRMRGDAARALEYFERARPILSAEPVAGAMLDSNQAQALLDLNRFEEAELFFNRSLGVLASAGMTRAAAIVNGNLADLLCRQGRLERALRTFEDARLYFERDGATGDLARLQAERADALALAGLLDAAAAAYAAALPPLRAHGLVDETARAAVGLGRVLVRLGRRDESKRALGEAAEIYDADDRRTGQGRVRLVEGEIAIAAGDAGAATRAFETALALLGDRPAEAALARQGLASVLIANDRLADADRALAPALEIADQAGLAPLRADLLHTRARLHAAREEPDAALSDLREAVRQVESIRGTLQAGRLRAGFLGDRTAVYEDLCAALLARGTETDQKEAFAVTEQARGRSLLDLVAGAVDLTSIARDSDHELVRRAAAARDELNAYYSRLPETDRFALSAWKREVVRLEGDLTDLEARLEASRGVGGLLAAPVDFAQARLGPGTALLEYFFVHERLTAFVVDETGLTTAREIASRDELVEHAERLRFQIDRVLGYGEAARGDARLVADAISELQDLHGLLIAPVAEALAPAERLVVVPHGILHALPFHALHDGQQFLIERREVVQLPSASLLRHLMAEPERDGPALVIGVPDERARHIEDEARSVAGALPNAALHLGDAATVDRLREEGRHATLIHLACHGRFSGLSPLSSGLKLADRWLTARELYDMRFDGAIVVLSGCDTAYAAVEAGDELAGLVRGFFVAGASALVLGLWPVHDQIAAETMAAAYRIWHNGKSSSPRGFGSALRAAMCDTMGRWPHPAFWAPFVRIGRL